MPCCCAFFPRSSTVRRCSFPRSPQRSNGVRSTRVYSFTKGVLPTSGTNLELVADLGALWERQTGLPLPLGGIVASRELPAEVRRTFDRVLHDSIAYALEHPTVSRPFVREHARELDDEVIDRHIALFVNRYSLALGEEGRRAVRELTGLPDLRLGWEPLHGS